MLRAAGLRARLRISADGVVLAVKGRAAVSAGGVATRMELEAPASEDLDPGAWPPSAAQQLVVDTIGGAPLVEIAAVRQQRQVRLVRRGDALIELSLDRLAALGGDGAALVVRIELEAELKAGPAGALEELAGALAIVDGLGPPLGSKLEFALAARRER